MTNYEHYKDQISRITRLGVSFAKIKGGDLDLCQNIECEDCEFNDPLVLCDEMTLAWADEECEEPEVDWSKVPVDTKIYVMTHLEGKRHPRYFAKYENGFIWAWNNGTTSFSAGNNGHYTCWKYAELAEE